jgi:hypothetical protein
MCGVGDIICMCGVGDILFVCVVCETYLCYYL